MGQGQLDNPDKIVIKDEGITIGVSRTIDIRGAGVQAVATEGIVHIEVAAGSGMGSHALLGGFHYMGIAGPSGHVLTNIGSGVTPTFAPPALAAMATHSFLESYHLHPESGSGNVLTSLGSGAIPTYTSIPVSGMATHSLIGTYHAMPPGASGALLRSLGSGAVPTFTNYDVVGSLPAHTHEGSLADHSLLGVFHIMPESATGALLRSIGSGLVPTFTSYNIVGSLATHATLHLAGASDPISHGSLANTHLYPIVAGGIGSAAVQSGNVASGAVLIDELRTKLTVPSGYCWKTLTEGGVPTWSPDLIGGGMATHAFVGTYHGWVAVNPSGNVLTSLGNDAIPTFAPPVAGGLATHSFIGTYHAFGEGASGNVLTSIGSGSIPTYAVPMAGGVSTHAFIGTYHAFGEGASGNILTSIGSGLIPTYALPPAGMATHSLFGTYHALNDAPSGYFLTGVGSGLIPTYTNVIFSGHVGSTGAHGVLPFANLPTHSLFASFHALGDAPSGNFLTGMGSGSIPTYSNTVFAGHVGSAGAHGALPLANLPTHSLFASFHALGDAPSGNFLVGMGSGAIPTYSSVIFSGHVGSGGAHGALPFANLPTHSFIGSFHAFGAGASGDLLTCGGSGSVPTFSSVLRFGTHALFGTYHALNDAPSGYFLTGVGSGLIPTYSNTIFSGHVGSTGAHGALPFANLPTHAFMGSFHAFGAGASGDSLICMGSGSVPTFNTYQVIRSMVWYVYGTLAVGSQYAAQIRADRQLTLVGVTCRTKVAPSGDLIRANIINIVGTSIFASMPYISNGTIGISTYSFGTAGVASGSWLQLDLMQVGSSNPGNDLSVQLTVRM